jgi:hypothetical protein
MHADATDGMLRIIGIRFRRLRRIRKGLRVGQTHGFQITMNRFRLRAAALLLPYCACSPCVRQSCGFGECYVYGRIDGHGQLRTPCRDARDSLDDELRTI